MQEGSVLTRNKIKMEFLKTTSTLSDSGKTEKIITAACTGESSAGESILVYRVTDAIARLPVDGKRVSCYLTGCQFIEDDEESRLNRVYRAKASVYVDGKETEMKAEVCGWNRFEENEYKEHEYIAILQDSEFMLQNLGKTIQIEIKDKMGNKIGGCTYKTSAITKRINLQFVLIRFSAIESIRTIKNKIHKNLKRIAWVGAIITFFSLLIKLPSILAFLKSWLN